MRHFTGAVKPEGQFLSLRRGGGETFLRFVNFRNDALASAGAIR
jgi:hypothetical protein